MGGWGRGGLWPLADSHTDWLVDRRHCNLKWQSLVLTIREKINTAIQDMPESQEIAQLLSGSCESSGVPSFQESCVSTQPFPC